MMILPMILPIELENIILGYKTDLEETEKTKHIMKRLVKEYNSRFKYYLWLEDWDYTPDIHSEIRDSSGKFCNGCARYLFFDDGTLITNTFTFNSYTREFGRIKNLLDYAVDLKYYYDNKRDLNGVNDPMNIPF